MTQSQVVELMKSSNSEENWIENADQVEEACGGYPSFWNAAIVESGLMEKVTSNW